MTPVEIKRTGGCAVTLYDASAVRSMQVSRTAATSTVPAKTSYNVDVAGVGGVWVTREMFDAIKAEVEKL